MALSNGWRFSGSLRDLNGLRNHAAPVGGSAQYAAGHTGSALVCEDGRGAVATIPAWRYYYDVAPGRFAAEVWVTSTSPTAAVRTALAKGDAWSIDLSNASGNVRFVHGGYVVDTTTSVLDGDAHHILVVYDYTSSNPYVFEYKIYVDGALVKTDAGNATVFSDTEADKVYFGCLSPGVQGADALIEDVRIWSDPVHPDEVATVNFTTPVWDGEVGVWPTAGSGAVTDLGPQGNDLTLTSNGQRGSGWSGGTAIRPVDPAAGWTAQGALTLDRDFDRFSLTGRFAIARSGVQQRVLEISRSSGDPILAFDIAPNGLPTVHAYNDDGDHWIAAQNVATITNTNTWYNVSISVYPGAIRWRFGTRVTYSQDVAPGFYPLNAPAYSDADTISLDGKWQDLRLVATYVSPDEWDQWEAMPLVQPTGAQLGSGRPLTMWLLRDGGLVPLDPEAVQGLPEEPDTVAPPAPTGLVASGVTSQGFTLDWNEAVDAGEAPDTTAPSTPTGLVASAITSTGFTLGWSASDDS